MASEAIATSKIQMTLEVEADLILELRGLNYPYFHSSLVSKCFPEMIDMEGQTRTANYHPSTSQGYRPFVKMSILGGGRSTQT